MKKILVVEDNLDISRIIKLTLENEGYKVIVAYDGLEALNKIMTESPDLIILDIMLPKLDGYSVNIKLKENDSTKDIFVIAITGKGNFKELLNIKEQMNVSAYFEKPFPMKLLKEKVKELLKE
jgi:DNA-binding response OmpR family regulator